MKTYNEQIVKAYTNWMAKIDAEVDNKWDNGYKAKIAASKRACNKFIALCRLNDLNYVQVAKDLCPPLNLQAVKY